jgi:hypothetical protein
VVASDKLFDWPFQQHAERLQSRGFAAAPVSTM